VQAGSLVLKDVEAHTRWAGIPAKQVGVVSGKPALEMTQINVKEENTFCDTWGKAVRQAVLAEEAVLAEKEGLAGAPDAPGSGKGVDGLGGVTVSAADGEVTYSFGGGLGGGEGESTESGLRSGPESRPAPDSVPPVPGEGQGPHQSEHIDFGCGI